MANPYSHQLQILGKRKIFLSLWLLCGLLLVVVSSSFFGIYRAHPAHADTISTSDCHNEQNSYMVPPYDSFYDILHDNSFLSTTVIGSLDIELWYCPARNSSYARFTYYSEDPNYVNLTLGGCTLTSYKNSALTPLDKSIDGCTGDHDSGVVLYNDRPVDTQLLGGKGEFWVATFSFEHLPTFHCGVKYATPGDSCVFSLFY